LEQNQINDQLLERIHEETQNNKGIVRRILPALGPDFEGNELNLEGEELKNLDFLAKFLRENPSKSVSKVNIDVKKLNESEY